MDLIVYHYGMENCKPSHSYGPALRDHFLLHYIISGSGLFELDGKSYTLHANQGFLICPDVITYYEASSKDPWIYTWIGFRGIKAETFLKNIKLDKDNPVFKCKGDIIKKCFEEIRHSSTYKLGYELRLQGYLNILLSELTEQSEAFKTKGDGQKKNYIKKSIQFIETNYSRSMSIESLASYIGLNKNYFSTIFSELLGIPPQEYLIKYRVNKACKLLSNKDLTISEISRSVGYDDPLGFSKIFKQIKGVSPKSYRQALL
ncbi:AraC family transcriptional regulator [Clostridium estertheticum]|nr:AraC family transcriptional regulator [Clostridium estertheticum]MBX4268485.1 AraC family transcriptional regulator [Clostridium estertheticum]WLC81868.1 AraC family transcriptional regulator [Clostridium estertheticum]